MLRIVSVYIISLLALIARAQIDQPIIDKVNVYPSSYKKYERLAEKINNDFQSDKDRAAAIYVWVANNIAYDTKVESMASARFTYRTLEEKRQKEEQLRTELALTALKKQKAVCQGYSELFRLLCLACGIECEVISGYSKTEVRQIGFMPKVADHAWNVIRLNGQWQLVDVTWGAGYVDGKENAFVADFSDVYFLMAPGLFALNHYPEDNSWLMTDLSEKQFKESALYHRAYLKSNISIKRPVEGIITKAKGGKIKVEIDGDVALEQLAYAFHDQKYMQKVSGERKGERLILTIPVGTRRRAYLDIIADFETLVTYKLQLK